MRLLLLTSIFILFTNISAKEQDESDIIRLTSDNWCPYTCMDTKLNQGLIVDVTRAAFEEFDLTIEYSYSSWTRAIQNVINGDYDVLLGSNKEQEKDFDSADNFFIYDETVFAVRLEDKVTINDGKDLKNYKLGHVLEYNYGDTTLWDSYIQNHPNSTKITSSAGEKHLLTLLKRKRIDLAVLNFDVAQHYIKQSDKFKNIQLIRKENKAALTIGFARTKKGEKYRKLFNLGFSRLIGTQKLQDIFDKYNIEMPDYKLKNYKGLKANQ